MVREYDAYSKYIAACISEGMRACVGVVCWCGVLNVSGECLVCGAYMRMSNAENAYGTWFLYI